MTFYTPPTLATRWGCKPSTVRALIEAGKLPAFNLASPTKSHPRWRISEASVEAFENSRQQPPEPQKPKRRKSPDIIQFYE